MKQIALNSGYEVISNFSLPKEGWETEFYQPLEKRLTLLENQYSEDEAKMIELEAMREEIAIYRKYNDFYGYEFNILQKK